MGVDCRQKNNNISRSFYYCFGNEKCFGWNVSDDDVILGATLVHLCTFFRDLFILGLKIEWTWHLPTEHFFKLSFFFFFLILKDFFFWWFTFTIFLMVFWFSWYFLSFLSFRGFFYNFWIKNKYWKADNWYFPTSEKDFTEEVVSCSGKSVSKGGL